MGSPIQYVHMYPCYGDPFYLAVEGTFYRPDRLESENGYVAKITNFFSRFLSEDPIDMHLR